jgi:hypothetical protein
MVKVVQLVLIGPFQLILGGSKNVCLSTQLSQSILHEKVQDIYQNLSYTSWNIRGDLCKCNSSFTF